MTTTVQAYITLKQTFDTHEEAEAAISSSLGLPGENYIDVARVVTEDANGLTLDSEQDEWFSSETQTIAYNLRIVEPYDEEEQYQSGTEFYDVDVDGFDADGNPVTTKVPQEYPVYETRTVTKERSRIERWAVSYVR